MKTQAIRERMGGIWTSRHHGWWRQVELAGIRALAAVLKASDARFVALTVHPEGAGLILHWHWDVAGTLLAAQAALPPGAAVPSLVDLWPGADWAEREARDYYAVSFTGRESTPPLMLRESDSPGVLLAGKDEVKP